MKYEVEISIRLRFRLFHYMLQNWYNYLLSILIENKIYYSKVLPFLMVEIITNHNDLNNPLKEKTHNYNLHHKRIKQPL